MLKLKKQDKEIKVFIDSSVIIAATLSPSGGSFRLIRESHLKNYKLFISEYILDESLKILKMKFPEKVYTLLSMLDFFKFKIVKDPPEKEVEKLIEIVDFKDAAILAGAIKCRADYLVTLDRKHLLNQKVLEFAKIRKLFIFTPKDFLEESSN